MSLCVASNPVILSSSKSKHNQLTHRLKICLDGILNTYKYRGKDIWSYTHAHCKMGHERKLIVIKTLEIIGLISAQSPVRADQYVQNTVNRFLSNIIGIKNSIFF